MNIIAQLIAARKYLLELSRSQEQQEQLLRLQNVLTQYIDKLIDEADNAL